MILVDTFTETGGYAIDSEPLTSGQYLILEAVQAGLLSVDDLTDEQYDTIAFALDAMEAKDDRTYVRDAHGRFARVGSHGAPTLPGMDGPGYTFGLRTVDAPSVASPKASGEDYVPMAPGAWTPELRATYDAVRDKGATVDAKFPNPVLLDRLQKQATAFAHEHGLASDGTGHSPADIFANGVIKRVITDRMQDMKPITDPFTRQSYLNNVLDIREGSVAIAATREAAQEILSSGRFKTQFETGTSGGALNAEMRAISEMQQFNHHPVMPPEKRTVYGYMAPEGNETQEGVGQYGSVRFILKDSVRERSTMTIGDSLSTGAIPIPVDGPVTDEQMIRARALGTIFSGDSGVRLAASFTGDWLDEDYAEAQIHGGVSLDDVQEIHVVEDYIYDVDEWSTSFGPYAATLRARGIDVVVDGQRLELG